MPVCWSLHGSALYWHPATWHFPLSLDDLTIAAPDIQDIADPANNNGFRYRKFIVGQCFDHWTILVKTFTSDKINMFSFTCIFRIKISLFLPWIYFPFGAFVFLSWTLLLLGMHVHVFKILPVIFGSLWQLVNCLLVSCWYYIMLRQ